MNLLSALAKIGSMTMLSRVLGFVRDAVLARIFGAGIAMDAFVVAFRLPNLLRRIFAEGAFSQAFVPILAEYRQKKSPAETQEFVQHVAGMLMFALLIVTAIGVLAAPAVIWVTASGWGGKPEKFMLASQLLRIIFPYILLISLSSLVGSILNTYGKFSVPAFTPVLLNVLLIGFALLGAKHFEQPVMALGWGVFCGGVLQLGFQLPWLFKLGFLKIPKLRFGDPAVNRVIKQMAPAILGTSVAQVSLVINTNIASYLQSGSVSWMYFADRLMELPTGVLGVALGTILLPGLSKHAATGDKREFSALLDWGLRLCLLLTAPAAVGMAVLAFPLVATLFMYNKIGVHDAQMTQQALIAYAVGLLGLILIKVLAPGFYAQKNIKTPVKVAIVTLVCTQLMNLMFVWKLQHAGLALSISLGACINAAFLFLLLRIKEMYQPKAGWRAFLLKLAIALAVMAGGLWAAQHYVALEWVHVGGLRRTGQLFALIGFGMVLYFSTLGLLGFRPRHFKRREM